MWPETGPPPTGPTRRAHLTLVPPSPLLPQDPAALDALFALRPVRTRRAAVGAPVGRLAGAVARRAAGVALAFASRWA